MFFGAGPFVNYRFRQYENWRENYNSNSDDKSTNYSKQTENFWNIGISTFVGLECIIYKNINLFAEYEAVINVGWRKIMDDYDNRSIYFTYNYKNNKIWGYELKGLKMGLGIYF